jgi:CheY-like chemotaxis protein
LARTVLLADDSVTAQNMGRRILTDAGYEVITVNNGSAALKKIHESKPDLIVLDVYMPGYGGLEICQRLKESDATMRIPVLLTVGKMEPFKTDEAKRVRADGHIVKPFDASELLAALTKLEDRIVPQSETGRSRGTKSETKKLRRWRGEEVGAEEEDDEMRNDRISYLEEVKRRHAKSLKEAAAEPRGGDNSLTGIERQARMSSQENSEDAVTFASGPIPAPHAWPAAPQSTAPEFPIEKEVASDPVKAEETSVSLVEQGSAKESEPVPAEAVAESQSKPAEAPSDANAGDEKAEPKVEAGPRWVAKSVALSAEEASRSLDEEMRQAHAVAEPAPEHEEKQPTVEAESPSVPDTPAKDEETSPKSEPEPETSGAAFAAAASASASSGQAEAVSSSTSDPAPVPEVAASLENWERIRDTVVGQQAAEAIAQTVAAMAEGGAPTQKEVSAESDSDSSSETAGAPRDPLSSIVDNVLAELKPRLLAEIAKQLANDKK